MPEFSPMATGILVAALKVVGKEGLKFIMAYHTTYNTWHYCALESVILG